MHEIYQKHKAARRTEIMYEEEGKETKRSKCKTNNKSPRMAPQIFQPCYKVTLRETLNSPVSHGKAQCYHK